MNLKDTLYEEGVSKEENVRTIEMVEDELLRQVLIAFYWLREQTEMRKRPSTSELIDWIAALRRAGVSSVTMEEKLPFLGVLLKHEQDLDGFFAAQSRTRRGLAN